MGQEIRQDMAVSLPVILELLRQLELDWCSALESRAWRGIATLGAFICIAFCGSFRGAEVFLVDCAGLWSYLRALVDPNLPSHIIIPLLRRFKNEIGSRYHLTPLSAITSSGINVKLWVSRLVDLRDSDNHLHGPAFCDSPGKLLSSRELELDILDRIQLVQEQHPALIPATLIVHDAYGISRSF